jgi:hypothetical protein
MTNAVQRLENYIGFPWPMLVIALVATLATITQGIILAVVLWRTVFIDPPVSYDSAEYEPVNGTLCPGNLLDWNPSLTVRNSGRVDVVRIFWNRDTDQAARDTAGLMVPEIHIVRALPASSQGKVIHNLSRVFIPNLPPGRYWMVTNTIGAEGGESQYNVPFSVPEGCQKK